MHFSANRYWVVLTALIVSAGAVSVPRPYVDPSATVHLLHDSLKNVQIDSNSAQASFIVPCSGCIGGPDGTLNQSFLFDFQAFPSERPCGPNNLTLNGIQLLQDWESTGVRGQGLASVNSSGHELNLFLHSDCLYGDASGSSSTFGATQLVTLTIEKVDNHHIHSLSGFTLSFKQSPSPELLRLSIVPDFSARDLPESETWRDPPASVRLIPTPKNTAASTEDSQSTLEDHLEDLKRLEVQANQLIKLIQEKKDFITTHFPETTKGLKEEIKECGSFLCVVKAIGRRVHNVADAVKIKVHNLFHEPEAYHWSPAGGQAPTMLATPELPEAPEECHCHDSRPRPRPPPYRGHVPPPSEKIAFNASESHTSEPKWRDAADPSPIAIVFKTLLIITGLAFLYRFIKRRCMSLRKRAERAAERERRHTEMMYKCAARKQSWRDWWYGKRRGKPGYRPGDYEEKRALILQQEGILEGAMQDEIHQLRIQEEIRQLRSTRDAVDNLVRAEEGRNNLPAYASSSMHPFGFTQLPAPITIPSAASGMYPASRESSDDQPNTPLSRTSSLPDYKTDASSEPPAYDSDDMHDGFSDYSPSTHTMDSHWTPGSSIPDISPRPSIETARTFL